MTDEERREHDRKYYAEHRDAILARKKKYRAEHAEKVRESQEKYIRKHREERCAYMRNYNMKRRGKWGAVAEYIPEGCVYPDCECCPLEDCMREGV